MPHSFVPLHPILVSLINWINGSITLGLSYYPKRPCCVTSYVWICIVKSLDQHINYSSVVNVMERARSFSSYASFLIIKCLDQWLNILFDRLYD